MSTVGFRKMQAQRGAGLLGDRMTDEQLHQKAVARGQALRGKGG